MFESATIPTRNGEGFLFRTLVTGIDGTDESIVKKEKVDTPSGSREIVLGHEAVAKVVRAPKKHNGLREGDLVVPLVRQGCGSCRECQAGAVDLCPSDDYQEHGIKGLDGFMQDFWFDREDHVVLCPRELRDWGVLVEPLSIAVKAIQQAKSLQARIPWFDGFEDQNALVVGTGSLGAMACVLLRSYGIPTSALDRHGAKAASTRLLNKLGVQHLRAGSTKRNDGDRGFDLILETTGVPKVIVDALARLNGNGVCVLLGIPTENSSGPRYAESFRRLVLRNQAVVGSVNSNRSHFETAMSVLKRERRRDPDLLDLIITNRFPPEKAKQAFKTEDESVVKKVIDWSDDRES